MPKFKLGAPTNKFCRISAVSNPAINAGACDLPKGMTDTTVFQLREVASAYENAIFTCLHAAVKRMKDRGFTSVVERVEWDVIQSYIPVSKAEATMRCLKAINNVLPGSPEEGGLLPLLFIVACETGSVDQAMEALRRMQMLEQHTGLGNIRSASALVRQVWDHKTLEGLPDWRELLKDSPFELITS